MNNIPRVVRLHNFLWFRSEIHYFKTYLLNKVFCDTNIFLRTGSTVVQLCKND